MIRTIFTLLYTLMLAIGLNAQIVESVPSPLYEGSQEVKIIYHAAEGSGGLKGYTGEVYAHTGVITNRSTAPSDWKHAPSWGDNNEKYKLTRTSADTYELNIGDIRTYYNMTDTSEHVRKLAFVFRSGDCSREGKTSAGGDIFIELGEKAPIIPSPQASYPGGVPKMGATKGTDSGTIFCLAAPGKKSVSISGSWNCMKPQLMNYQDYEGMRYFWLSVADLADGQDYYNYSVDGDVCVADPYSHLIIDPAADLSLPGFTLPDALKEVDGQVTVYNTRMDEYPWQTDDFKAPQSHEMVIYEMLLRDFTGTEGESKGDGTINLAFTKLDYLASLGINAVELMPVMEFSGHNSWGYNPNFYFALDKAYGTPQDLKRFVDECHKRGIAVILDVVFNHADSQAPWVQMYAREANPFINAVAPHDYSVFNDWRQEHPLVQQMQDDCLRYWMTAYKVDGFRFDLVKGMGDSDSYNGNTEKYNPSRVKNMDRLRKVILSCNPRGIHINENLASAQEENEMAQSGQLNWHNVNYNSRQYAKGVQPSSNTSAFFAPNTGRTWGSTVAYAESHDEERMGYAQTSEGGNDYVKRDLATRMKRLGSLAAQMLMTPGPKMIWQFQEMGNNQTTKQSGGNDTSPKRVSWMHLNESARLGLHDTYKNLMAVRRNNPSLFAPEAEIEMHFLESDWQGRSLRLTNGKDELLLLVNPDIKEPRTVQADVTQLTADNCQTLVQTPGSEAKAEFAGVKAQCTLKAGEFIVIGTKNLTEIEDIISPSGSESEERTYDLQGREVTGQILAPGVYIRTGANAGKFLVR